MVRSQRKALHTFFVTSLRQGTRHPEPKASARKKEVSQPHHWSVGIKTTDHTSKVNRIKKVLVLPSLVSNIESVALLGTKRSQRSSTKLPPSLAGFTIRSAWFYRPKHRKPLSSRAS